MSHRQAPALPALVACVGGLACVGALACSATPRSPAPATPQRPTFATGTATTAADTFELETGLVLDPGDTFDSPTTLKYGWDERTEVFVRNSPRLKLRTSEDWESGTGDVAAGIRQRVRDEDERGPAVAWMTTLKIPTADQTRGLGSGEPDLLLAGSVSSTFGLTSLCGFWQAEFLGRDNESTPALGQDFAVLACRPIAGDLSGFAELALRFVPVQNIDARFATFGLAWAATPWCVYDMAIVEGLNDGAPDHQVLFGVTINLGR